MPQCWRLAKARWLKSSMRNEVNDLPLNGRYVTQLVLMSGAAITISPSSGDLTGSKNFYSSTTISVAGGQANATNYLLDGGYNVDTFTNVNMPFPFPDALQEFSVETSSLPAQYGESSRRSDERRDQVRDE